MSACDECTNPGQCCKDFALNIGALPADSWREAGEEKMRQHGLPFIPIRLAVEGIETNGGPAEAHGKVMIRFGCPLVTTEGRCGDYENRPNLCRIYEPRSDALCALYVKPVETADKHEKDKELA